MEKIRDLANQAMTAGYLSVEAEKQLRQLLQHKYEVEDFNAFMNLQEAARVGSVKQESREILQKKMLANPKPTHSFTDLSKENIEELEIDTCIKSVLLWYELFCREHNSIFCLRH